MSRFLMSVWKIQNGGKTRIFNTYVTKACYELDTTLSKTSKKFSLAQRQTYTQLTFTVFRKVCTEVVVGVQRDQKSFTGHSSPTGR